MFNFSMGELGIIATVALVVLGPTKLPEVARTAGNLMGKAQRLVAQVKGDIKKEVELSELKQIQEDAKKVASDLEADLRNTERDIERNVDSLNKSLNDIEKDLQKQVEEPAKSAEENIQIVAAESELAAPEGETAEIQETESAWNLAASEIDTSDLDSAFSWNEATPEQANELQTQGDMVKLAQEVERLRSLVEANDRHPKSTRRYAKLRSLRGNFVTNKPMPRRPRNV